MALHCATTCAIAVLAAGLGSAITHPHGHTPDGARWLLCGSVAGYFGVGILAAVVAGASWRRILLWALPCLLLTLLLAVSAVHFGAVWLLWGLVAAVVWQIVCASDVPGRVSGGRGA
ncbi:hypothetical protein [Streptomyces sp. NPDC051364]